MTGLSARAFRILASSWVLGIGIVLLSWPPTATTPGTGLDPSWLLALQMAAAKGLHWGTDLIFTYGPLGFLRFPLVANTWAAILSIIYLLIVRLALATSVIWIARRRFTLPVAVIMAFVTVALSGKATATVTLCFIWCAVAIAEDPPAHACRLVVVGGGVLSALELLVKLDEGLLIVGMCTVAVTAMRGPRGRNILTFALVLLGCLVTFWFAAGQAISNVDDFVVGAFQVIRGYSGAMETTGAAWIPVVALVTWAATLVATWLAGRGLPTPQRVGLFLLVFGFGFVAWKEGFARQSLGHVAIFFGWMLAPWIALRWRGYHRWIGAGGFAAVAILYFAATGLRVESQFRPVQSAEAAVSDLRTVFEPARRDRARFLAKVGMTLLYRLDDRSQALLRGKTVAVWPWETSMIWAYGLEWKPLPMFQSYSSYTPWLDRRNAALLASAQGPQRILRHTTNGRAVDSPPPPTGTTSYSIDGRYAAYDSPAASLAMLCHFEALRTTDQYQVLGRVRDRCGSPRFLGSTSAEYQQPVRVPSPPGHHDIVFGRIDGAAPSGIESVRTFLYRAIPTYVVFNGKIGYRLVPSVADDGLILTAPASSDFPKPFALAPKARTVELVKDSGLLSPRHELRFDFYAMSVRPPVRSHDPR